MVYSTPSQYCTDDAKAMNQSSPSTRLAAARVLRGLKPGEVERRTKISRSTLWRAETRGIDSITVGNLAKLCKLYGVSADWIISGEGSEMHLRAATTHKP